VLSNSFQLWNPDLVEELLTFPETFYKIFTLCLQFEPELPEEKEESDEEEEVNQEEEAGEDAVPEGNEDAARAAMPPPPPAGAGPRDRPPTRRSRFWSEGEEPLSKGLPYTGKAL